jgi:hypothetical protein
MKINLSKPAVSLDGKPLFENNASIGMALGSYLMEISTPNPRDMQVLSLKILTDKDFDVNDQELAMLIEVTNKSNFMNILKVQLLDNLVDIPEMEVAKDDSE